MPEDAIPTLAIDHIELDSINAVRIATKFEFVKLICL